MQRYHCVPRQDGTAIELSEDQNALYVPTTAIIFARPMLGPTHEGRSRTSASPRSRDDSNRSHEIASGARSLERKGVDKGKRAETVYYWKSKVIPRIKKVFDRNGKRATAAEACKTFNLTKAGILFSLPLLLLLFFFFFFYFYLLLQSYSRVGLVQEEISKELKRGRLTSSPNCRDL
ncbi:hypothetical protein B296_00021646 [Ensete ventricosum]|uniref:Uncharacterized protein n=1 Tax=Ensete ventricosum TaxID=4639 RepID=A0A427AGS7_ENSVE|nr:hypothetical protein B296_00021646 [Ensete ventricosum]